MSEESVLFVKLTNGEEIIARVGKKKEILVLMEPMTIEYGEQDGRRLIFMSRYNPFLKERTITIPRSQVCYFGAVSVEVKEYYMSSLSYCKEIMDETFRRGIRQASQYTSEQIEEEKMDAAASALKTGSPDDDEWLPANTTLH